MFFKRKWICPSLNKPHSFIDSSLAYAMFFHEAPWKGKGNLMAPYTLVKLISLSTHVLKLLCVLPAPLDQETF